VQVHGLPASLLVPAQDLGQAARVVDPQDVDVVLAAEGLDEGEVDLEGHVFHVLVVRGQDAQNHVIRISGEEKKRKETDNVSIELLPDGQQLALQPAPHHNITIPFTICTYNCYALLARMTSIAL